MPKISPFVRNHAWALAKPPPVLMPRRHPPGGRSTTARGLAPRRCPPRRNSGRRPDCPRQLGRPCLSARLREALGEQQQAPSPHPRPTYYCGAPTAGAVCRGDHARENGAARCRVRHPRHRLPLASVLWRYNGRRYGRKLARARARGRGALVGATRRGRHPTEHPRKVRAPGDIRANSSAASMHFFGAPGRA
jgi:hypothetical protein